MPKKTSPDQKKKRRIKALQKKFVEAANKPPVLEVFKSGIYSLEYERYRLSEGVSKSMLDWLADYTPAHLQHYLIHGEKETEGQRFGRILHRALLEPDSYKGAFYVKPEGMKFSNNEGKAWKAEHLDRPLITAAEEKQITGMVSSVHTHPMAKRLLYGGQTEACIYALDGNGILRKMRLDSLTKGTVIPDIKTVADARTEVFERVLERLRYHVQAAYYLDGVKLVGIEKFHFVLILVEKDPPYLVRCLQVMPEVVELGHGLYMRDLQMWMNIQASGKWPGWSEEIEEIGLPEWSMKRMMNEKLPISADGTEQILADQLENGLTFSHR